MTAFVERYERDGNIWSIRYDEGELTVVEDGVERIETFAGSFPAYARFAELSNAKRHSGWVLVEEPEPYIVRNARNPALEAPLIENPHDRAAWLVYGDWLEQQGDPRGVYIALRAAWHANPADAFAPLRVQRYEARHGAYFRGRLTRGQLGMGGFVDQIELTQWTLEDVVSDDARFVTNVTISSSFADGVDLAIERAGAHLPPTVRTLSLVAQQLTRLEPLEPTLDRLHELRIRAPVNARLVSYLAAQPLPHLTRFTIHGEPMIDVENTRVIASAPWAAHLSKLGLFDVDDAAARILIDSVEQFPTLQELTLDDLYLSPETKVALRASWGARLEFVRMHDPYDYG